jgi:hypothetical protein
MARKTKSISFDLDDAFEKSLLNHTERVEKGKFSRYIKRLISEDMKSKHRIAEVAHVHYEVENDDSDINDAKNSFL